MKCDGGVRARRERDEVRTILYIHHETMSASLSCGGYILHIVHVREGREGRGEG